MHPHPCPDRGCPARFVTSRELRESVATYVFLRSGEHERVNERNPSKARAKAPAFIYSGVITFFLSTTSVSICVRGIKEKKLSIYGVYCTTPTYY